MTNQPTQPLPKWIMRKVTLLAVYQGKKKLTKQSDGTMKMVKEEDREVHLDIEANTYDNLAIHQARVPAESKNTKADLSQEITYEWFVDKEQWVITHMLTGLSVCKGIKTYKDAQMIATNLHRVCSVALENKDKDQAVKAVPPWVVKWLRACSKEGGYLNMERFKKEG